MAPAGSGPAGGRGDSTVVYTDPVAATSTPSRVLRGFDLPEHDWLPGHRGVDLAAAPGDPVHSAADGTVAFAGVVAGTPVVSVDHADGMRTTYQPVRAQVAEGDRVLGGQPIGVLAAPVRDPAHAGLHWGARPGGHEGIYVNPLDLLDAPVIRLKPLHAPHVRPGQRPLTRADGPARRPS